MKKAFTYLGINLFRRVLMMPFGIEVKKIQYPAKDGKVLVEFEGDPLPVKEVKAGSKSKTPEVEYTVMQHWHNARILPVETGKEKKKNEKRD